MKKVIVTGGSGFVAGWVILDFLQNGYQVATSLRSMKKADQIKNELSGHLTTEQLAGLSFFEADLTSEKGWVEAMKGADGVIHVASPLGHGTESVEELVNVAKNGTLNVLKSAKKAGVKRVVMASSQAVSTPEAGNTEVLDESFWTDVSNPELDPYRISKVAAEGAAWDFAKKNDLELTTILPGAIFGPALSAKSISSDGILLQILKGMPMIPQVPLETSDVRDLGEIHRLTFEKEVAKGKRYLAASQAISMPEIAKLYQQKFPQQHLKVRIMPKWLTRFLAKFVPSLRSLVPMLDRKYRHTTAAAENDLGWKQHTPEQTVVDGAQSLIDLGLVK